MLEKQLARDLVPLVNGLDYPELVKYAISRIEQLHKNIENTSDINDVLRAQGAIQEMRQFLKLKEIVIADSR